MGPKNNLVHFKSLLGCLFIKSWSSSQHLNAGKQWRIIPSLPSHLVLHFTLMKWFRLGLQDWWGEILALLICRCNVSIVSVRGHISGVMFMFQLSGVTCQKGQNQEPQTHFLVRCHLIGVTFQVSCVTYYMSEKVTAKVTIALSHSQLSGIIFWCQVSHDKYYA